MATDPERWKRVEELYHATVEREPPDRGAFLSAACGDNLELRREVESLLAQRDVENALVDRPVWQIAEAMSGASRSGTGVRFTGGDVLGPYKILAPIGSGGMGEVYRARDTRLGREVAIKVLPATYSRDPDRMR